MQKRIVILTAALIAVFAVSMTAMAQALIMNLQSNDTLEVNCNGSNLVLSRQSNIKVKAVCQPGASAPTATPTPKPGPTNTPTPQPGPTNTPTTQPSGSLPLCADHDPTKWHPLVDTAKGCHYNHEHHDNPHDVDSVFGPVAALYGGQEISYPWQTFSDRGQENQVKHQGYKWVVRKSKPCNSAFSDGCLTDFRLEVHFIAAAMDATVRFHSFWLEARGCRENNPNVCGIIRTGGWADYGNLEVDNQHVSIPGDQANTDSGHRRIHYNKTGNSNYATWYGGTGLALTAIQTSRMWSVIDPNDPYAEHLFCPDFHCSNNGSTLDAHAVGFNISKSLDPDGDGLVTYSGYTNRYGDIVQGCKAVGLDCVPLQIVGMPVGIYQYRDDSLGIKSPNYDTSPRGQWWITFPN